MRFLALLGALISATTLADQTYPWIVPSGSTSQTLPGIYLPNVTDGTTFDASLTYESSGLVVTLWDGTNRVVPTLEPLIVCVQDDGGVYAEDSTDCEDNGADDFSFPATPANGDQLWFGSPSTTITKMAFNVTTAGVGTYTIAWKYWDGDSVEALTGVTDGTTGFKTSGLNTVTWTSPGDCGTVTRDSQSPACWIIATIDGGTHTTDPLIGEVFGCGSYGAPATDGAIWGRCEGGSYQLIIEDEHYSGTSTQYVTISDSGTAVMDWSGQIYLNVLDGGSGGTFRSEVFAAVVDATDGSGGGDQDLATATDVLTTVGGAIATVDTVVDAILVDTGTTLEARFDAQEDGTNKVYTRADDSAGPLFCEVNTANFAGSTTTLACILTNLTGGSVTQATSDLLGKPITITSGADIRETRYINSTTWDSGNSELQITLDSALPATQADAVTAIIN